MGFAWTFPHPYFRVVGNAVSAGWWPCWVQDGALELLPWVCVAELMHGCSAQT